MKTLKELWNLPTKLINAYMKERKRVIKLTDELIAESKVIASRCDVDVKLMEDNARGEYIRVLRDAVIRKENMNKELRNLSLELDAVDRSLPSRTWVPIVDRVENRSQELDTEWVRLDDNIRIAKLQMDRILEGSVV